MAETKDVLCGAAVDENAVSAAAPPPAVVHSMAAGVDMVVASSGDSAEPESDEPVIKEELCGEFTDSEDGNWSWSNQYDAVRLLGRSHKKCFNVSLFWRGVIIMQAYLDPA